jgi:hypothetical protein
VVAQSIGIVRLRTQAMEFSFLVLVCPLDSASKIHHFIGMYRAVFLIQQIGIIIFINSSGHG